MASESVLRIGSDELWSLWLEDGGGLYQGATAAAVERWWSCGGEWKKG